MTELGERLKKLRGDAGLTQSGLADKLNVHIQTVSKWERGKTLPDVSSLGAIADALGVPLESLLGDESGRGSVRGEAFDVSALGRSIAAGRRGLGLSQRELAEKTDVGADTVSKWERGIVAPSAYELTRLADMFSVSVSRLYYGLTAATIAAPAPEAAAKKRRLPTLPLMIAAAVLAVIVAFGSLSGTMGGPRVTVIVDGREYGAELGSTIEVEAPKKPGYEFAGWIDGYGGLFGADADGKSSLYVYADGAVYTPYYEIVHYKLDVWLGGGAMKDMPGTVTVEDPPVTLPVPVKDGAEFLGWYTDPECVGEQVTEVKCVGADITVYAKWSDGEAAVRLDACGGTIDGKREIAVFPGGEYDLPEATRGGCEFAGWYADPDGGDGPYYRAGYEMRNRTLYAVWDDAFAVGESGLFVYKKSSRSVCITGYKGGYGKNVDLVIPSEIDGLPVTEIGNMFSKFNGSVVFRSITLPDTLTELSEGAFCYAKVTEPLKLPASLRTIETEAFMYADVTLLFADNGRLERIEERAFAGATLRGTVSLPEGLEYIGRNAFTDVTTNGIALPESLSYVGKNAFSILTGSFDDRHGWCNIYVPAGLERAEANAFGELRIYSPMTQEEAEERGLDINIQVTVPRGECEVKLVSDGETLGSMRGHVIDLPVPEKDGCEFVGWRDGDGRFAAFPYIPTSEKTTLKAVFVRVEPGSGASSSAPRTITDGEVVSGDVFSTGAYWMSVDTDRPCTVRLECSTALWGVFLFTGGESQPKHLNAYEDVTYYPGDLIVVIGNENYFFTPEEDMYVRLATESFTVSFSVEA